jgi:NADH:ubiquinone oxidoreductase subunit
VRLYATYRFHREAAMQLLSTLFIRLTSRKVGQDRFGNTYWEARGRRDSYGRPMRRVLYAKEAQASAVPAEWWGWLHNTTENPLPEDAPRRPWQKEHLPNMTGTSEAWRPVNPAANRGGDYEAWTPGR